MIKHFLNPPNWFTSASLFCSILALSSIIAADEVTSELLARACVLVIFGGIFDLLDGRVARMTKRFSEFGVQLDSIADIVGFGVAPAMIAWTWVLQDLGHVGVAITFWYVLCAAFRLARFNVNTIEHTWSFPGHSQGLTSTMAGGVLVTFIWVFNGYLQHLPSPPAWSVGLLVFFLGSLMVSSIPFRNFKDLRRNKTARRYLALAFACCLTAAVVLDPSMLWGVGALLYLSIGIVDGIVVAFHQRQLTKLLLLDDLFDDFDDFDDDSE